MVVKIIPKLKTFHIHGANWWCTYVCWPCFESKKLNCIWSFNICNVIAILSLPLINFSNISISELFYPFWKFSSLFISNIGHTYSWNTCIQLYRTSDYLIAINRPGNILVHSLTLSGALNIAQNQCDYWQFWN